MEDDSIDAVRRFNRTVTQRIGALRDEYLARGRPLGESRVLWELDDAPTDVKDLRTRLDLDSGYTSRLLRSLEAAGLAEVEPDKTDRRARTVSLTARGLAERAVLDQRSDELASSLLAPLNEQQRSRLVDAMGVVERLLTAGLVEVEIEDPESEDARLCIQSYFDELAARFDTGFDAARTGSAEPHELTEPAGLLLVARLRGAPIGCGALKLRHQEPADIKRMWVARSARGLGVGRRILSELEAHAASRGAPSVRLDTNQALHEAIALYRSAGYVEIDRFNDEPYAHHWFEKRLVG